MSKYETYKPTGVDWIGEVPENWEVKRIKRIADIYRGASPRPIDDERYFDENGKYSWVRISDVTASDTFLLKTEEKLSELGSSLSVKIKEGDLFLSIAGSVGKPMISKIDACIHDGFLLLKSPKIDTKFFIYLLYADGIYGGLGKMGTQLNLNSQIVGSVIIPIPSKFEQLAIANYLDYQTLKIDRLIANKKAQAEKLKELRQIEINNAVTKGINQNAVMKDSGIEWLGEIPKHWEEKRLKNLVSPKITDGPHETPELVDDLDGIPFISAEAITENGINYDARGGNISVQQDRIYSLKCKPKRDDIFMVKSGSTTGRIGYVDSDLNFNIWSPLALIRSNSNTHSRYLYFALCSNYIQKQVQLTWSFGTQPNIGMGVIERLRVVIAPKSEQIEIAKYLQERTTAIDKLIKNIDAQIEKLKDLRKIKIYEAVTGKIKVNAYVEATA